MLSNSAGSNEINIILEVTSTPAIIKVLNDNDKNHSPYETARSVIHLL